MAMAGGAALLRSVATKVARAPGRLPSALYRHGRLPTSSGGLLLSRFSTSTGGSMPPPANLKGPQTYNKKVPSGNEWDCVKAAFKEAAPNVTFPLVFSGFMYYCLNPGVQGTQLSSCAASKAK